MVRFSPLANACGAGWPSARDLLGFLLGSSQLGLGLAQVFGGSLQAGLSVLQLLKDGGAAAFQDSSQETAQEPNQSPITMTRLTRLVSSGLKLRVITLPANG